MSGTVSQTTSAADVNAGTNTATLAIALTGVVSGDILHFTCTWDNGNHPGATVTFSDLTNGNWTTLDTVLATGAGEVTAHGYVKNTATGALAVTMTLSGTNVYKCATIFELTGVAFTAPDKHAAQLQTAPGTGTDAVTSGTMTPSATPYVIIAASNGNDDTNTRVATGTGFTSLGTIYSITGHTPLGVAEWAHSSTSPKAGTFTANLATNNYVTLAAIYLDAGAGAAPGNAIFYGAGTTS